MTPTSHIPRKRFGQNFLIDPSVIDKIIQAINPGQTDHIVEIGPGQGAITEFLIKRCRRLDAIELDKDLIPKLEKKFPFENFHLTQFDALKFDYSNLYQDQGLRVAGNLPYNISTPLLFHLLSQADIIKDMHFMLQKEVVDRLAAKPNTKAYGKLTVITQAQCDVTALFDIPPEAFNPPPKVQSAFVRLVPRSTPLISTEQWQAFEKTVSAAFAHRRKTLRNNLKNNFELEKATNEIRGEIGAEIDLSRRAESLSIDEFIKLSQILG